MQSCLAFVYFMAVVFAAKHKAVKTDHQSTPLLFNYKPVQQVFGNVSHAVSEQNARRRNINLKRNSAVRQAAISGTCDFPMNVLFLVDTSGSMSDVEFIQLHDTIPALAASILTTNSGSSFSIVSFEDKPIETLGETTDSCLTTRGLDIPQINLLPLLESIVVGGGYDWPETQLAAIMAVLNSPSSINWFIDPTAVNVILLITDAAFHYEGDAVEPDYPQLAPWGNSYDESQASQYCLNRYYPDPTIVAQEIVSGAVFFGTSVVFPSEIASLAFRTYAWFNTLLGQAESMVQPLPEDHEGWVENLQLIIDTVRSDVCGTATTTPLPTVTETLSRTGTESSTPGITQPSSEELSSTAEITQPISSQETSSTAEITHPISSQESSSTAEITPPSSEEMSSTAEITQPISSEEVSSTSEISQPIPSTQPMDSTGEITGSEAMTTEDNTTDECVCDTTECDGGDHHDCCWKQPAFLIALKKRPSEFDVHYKA